MTLKMADSQFTLRALYLVCKSLKMGIVYFLFKAPYTARAAWSGLKENKNQAENAFTVLRDIS